MWAFLHSTYQRIMREMSKRRERRTLSLPAELHMDALLGAKDLDEEAGLGVQFIWEVAAVCAAFVLLVGLVVICFGVCVLQDLSGRSKHFGRM